MATIDVENIATQYFIYIARSEQTERAARHVHDANETLNFYHSESESSPLANSSCFIQARLAVKVVEVAADKMSKRSSSRKKSDKNLFQMYRINPRRLLRNPFLNLDQNVFV